MKAMPYKVFFVEDEIITREGIRDNVDWHACGFEFCGEAADGEMALPLLGMIKPDVLITDIKMPFMDGLQLSKIVRERMPWVKIVILSGHDEFDYAREAIHLGVTEYLLKPVTVQKLQNTLQSLSAQLDEERKAQEKQRKLAAQVEENQAMLRERLLFRMIVGAVPPTEAIEKGQTLGLDLSARYYQVVILKIELGDRTEQYDYDEYREFQNVVADLAENDPDIFALKRDWGDMILLIKGNTSEFLEEERDLLLEGIRREVAKTRYQLAIGIGTPKSRIADLSQSFVEAFEKIQNTAGIGEQGSASSIEGAELPRVDKSAVENFLHFGMKGDFDGFFDAYLRPLGEKAVDSNLVKNYILMDVVLTASNMVNDLGGDVDSAIPELASIETVMSNVKSMEQLRDLVQRILLSVLKYRDSKPNDQYKKLVHRAKDYINLHHADHELSLHEVALHVNLSASHFSLVFSQEAGQTFKEYLTDVRINKAKELLRMTSLRSAEIAYQVGYNDPHYFSSVFKKHTGLSPMEFRAQV
jgi:two-component system, response regulator YesN